LVNSAFFDDLFDRPSVPTLVASAHELEGTVAVLRDISDAGARLLGALTPTEIRAARLADATDGLPNRPNPILSDAWDAFSQPWDDLEASTGA
jgi:hypothetical protein